MTGKEGGTNETEVEVGNGSYFIELLRLFCLFFSLCLVRFLPHDIKKKLKSKVLTHYYMLA